MREEGRSRLDGYRQSSGQDLGAGSDSVVVAARVSLAILQVISSSASKFVPCHRFIPLPKSDTPERIVSNSEVYDFELSAEQMARLDGLDEDLHVCWNPTGCA